MIQGKGTAVFAGVAIGKAYLFRRSAGELPAFCGDAEKELQAFDQARETARQQLQALFEKTKEELGEEQAMILDVQCMMLDDLDYIEAVQDEIRQGNSAAVAADAIGTLFSQQFAEMDDDYMRARSVDVKDMAKRLTAILCGGAAELEITEPVVLIADDLSPSETVQLPKDKILAFVTCQGSTNSHTAILARMMSIPSLVQTDIPLDDSVQGKTIIVDGFEGCYYLDPDQKTLAEMQDKQRLTQQKQQLLEQYRGKPTVSKSGKKIKLFANIGSPDDVQYVLKGDAEGVGLMRSEFLYLGRDTFPTEEELFDAYRSVVEQLEGRELVIRTLDIGADKKVDYFGLEPEENPALGYRGIRICLKQPEIFRPQMRAIYRASAFGPVSAMFPMIASVKEVLAVKEFCRTIREELKSEGIPFGEVALGVMIETPAAAVISRDLAKEVDFFSVGTNDLTQYTLAVDRQNAKLAEFCDTHHPAVLALLKMIVDNAHAEGIWAGICGELGADTTMTEEFLKMGYDELSMSPAKVLEVRRIICESEE